MKLTGIEVDESMLMPKQELIAFLKENGESDRALAHIRERYNERFGNDLIWHYPISDSMHKAVFIVPVKEGFISLPYDEVDKEDYELLELDDAAMFDEDSLAVFIDDFKTFADDLLSALGDMLLIVRNK